MRRALYLSALAVAVLAICWPAAGQVSIGVGITVGFAPPPLPEYEQPECNEDGAIWVPGYWAWDDDDADYYWVPGTWVMAPEPGLLWTPAYWAWDDDEGAYRYHDGYWAREVGYYGGINYGYGYFGDGFAGGRWDHDRFMYNTAVVHVNQTVVHNVYIDRTVVVNQTNVTRVSYNGGQGGTTARPTERQQQVAQERHFPPVQAQMQHRQAARTNPELKASTNQGRPPVAATAKPGDFHAHAVPARAAGGGWHPPADRRAAARPSSAREGGSQQPGNAGNRPNARPGENARPENARPSEIARPQQNTRPNESPRPNENPRPNEPRPAIPQARPNDNPRPNENPRPAIPQARPNENPRPEPPPARPNENRRPETPQTRPSEPPPNPHSENRAQPPQPRPERPAEPPRAEPRPHETKPEPRPKEPPQQ